MAVDGPIDPFPAARLHRRMARADVALVTGEPATTAAIVSAERMTLPFGAGGVRRLDCLYVVVDARADARVADFLTGWQRCCDVVAVDWTTVRRPASALVGVELRHCCGSAPGALRLVFDVRRDRESLDGLAETEALVVGSRPFGGFANVMAAYGVDGRAVRSAVAAAGAATGGQRDGAIAS